AVRSERSGVHPFTSVDVASTVGSAVIRSCESSRGERPSVNLEDPDVIVRADLVGEELFLSLDTTGESLHVREWRRFNHPSSIKPTLASALVRFSGWRGGPLLDPFAGGATIPVEAALRWAGMRVHDRRAYAYRRLRIYDPAVEAEERGSNPSPLPDPPAPGSIVGLEVNPKYYAGALKNVESAGVSGIVELSLADSTRWSPSRRFPFVVTNPPYGIRSGGRKRVVGLYRRFASRLPEILEPGGVVVAVTTEHRQMAAALSSAGLRLLDRRLGRHGSLWVGAVKAALA
ncbi:MAG: THUMP domain-containing protein, partial [Conexivisphaera sp.]